MSHISSPIPASPAETTREANEGLLSAPPLRPVSRDRKLPLSFAQQRLWFLDQFEPGSSYYNFPQAFGIGGELNLAALGQALNTLVARHESLRTSFTTFEGEPVQVIAESGAVEISVIDLGELPESEREDKALQLASEVAGHPFDLAKGPLMRASLLKLKENDHVLLLNMHHIITDGWSIGVLFRELTALYEAFATGKTSPLSPLALHYADFAVWQRQWLQGEALEKQLSYWREQLSNAPKVLELPTDRPRPSVQTFHGATYSVVLSPSVAKGLRAIGQREKVTLYMVLLAAFQVLLLRYSGQEDIVVGSPIANRTQIEVEDLIGFFVNTLVLRTDTSGDPTFRELLRRVRQVALGAYEHQDMPFEKLVEEFQPERSLSHNPLFQVMFALQNAPRAALELAGLTLRPVEINWTTSKFDMTLNIIEGGEGLTASFEYNTDLFDAATIERMLGHFQVLLEGIISDPSQHLSELPLLTPAERHQLLIEWNATQAAYPKDCCLHQLFEAQVVRAPDSAALVFENEQLSYGELNERANQLAHYLQRLGVGPEVMVGILMERSIDMVVSLLGVLKAGGAYVPLDPEFPAERLTFMLSDSRVSVVLTQAHLVKRLPSHDVQVVCVDSDKGALTEEHATNLDTHVSPESLAYVIYTSGSTGRPKAMMLPHSGVINCLLWMQDTFQLSSNDRGILKASLSFDASVWELFWPLAVGACVVVARPGGQRDGAYLVDAVIKHDISTIHFVPSMLPLFLERKELSEVSSLKRVICGGEALPVASLEQFFGRSTAALHNFYGPTETTIGSIDWHCERGLERPSVPIGRPISNTEVYILDHTLQATPVGVTGELYIGGAGVGRGYLQRPELTAESFVPHPFSREAGARLYRTGDLARYLADGNIEFLGRIDHQVKVRGYRIELGEIESVLNEHPWVSESVVVAREDEPGDKRLVAYLVGRESETLGISELRSYLKEKLPKYMVPSSLVTLEKIPLTANGKVDRLALPAPEETRPELEEAYVAPRTAVEEVIAGIWADVLKVERVGVDDNFFELGGHSLHLTKVLLQVQDALQVKVPLRSLFEEPTVGKLAKEIIRVRPGINQEIAQTISELKQLSGDEVERILSE